MSIASPAYAQPDFYDKIKTIDDLSYLKATLPNPIVFTNGCFDILHRGHVTYLAQARALGACLVLGVNSDASVRRQGKGQDRPFNMLADRLAVLASLASVDVVIAFDDDTPAALIAALQPKILVKGGDWSPDTIVGATETLARGGQVHSIPFTVERSTTALVNHIRTTSP